METSVGLTGEEIAQSKVLFGPAPILSTENNDCFDILWDQVIATLKPRDIVELIYVRRFIIETWTVERLSRHATVAVERRYRENLEHLHLRAKLTQAGKVSRHPLANATPSDIAHLVVLEDYIGSVDTDLDQILTRKASELDHNRALERSIGFQESLDSLIANASRRRDDVLRQMELYRCGLGEQARQAVEQALEDVCKPVSLEPKETPALAPSDANDGDD
jgi:hypothetical protein